MMISRVGLLNKQTIGLVSRNALNLSRPKSIASISLINRSLLFQTATVLSRRSISTVKTTSDEEQEALVAQRRNRPVSPHLQIYQPQLTWIMSSFHRITGVAMAGAFYALTCTFAATSILGIPFDTNTLVSAFTSLPVFLQYSIKAVCAYPFIYHFGNGLRHLIWDFGKELTIPGVYRTGYTVLGATAIIGTYLAFFWN
ncbi:SDH3 [Candida oxycetoniae]|uniref:SDH3 n=1 Tax=Candida oxycetoniae TaxID=497107 RepID=A0AAI9T0I3_9ASCO|nr:SDH3 [Candida oxycetoniae]KAI3405775.1 SDH3 [Candida oxycetoniae]